MGEDQKENGLDRSLISKGFLEDALRMKQWVSSRGDLDNFHIVLEVIWLCKRPPSPFKFNAFWIYEGGYIKLVKVKWSPCDDSLPF